MLNVKIIKSIQGTASINEDIVGYRENYCWVIDGATDLFDCKGTIGVSVAEYVALLSNELEKNCDNQLTLQENMSNAIKTATLKVLDIGKVAKWDYAKLPTFSFVFGRVIGDTLEYILIGDCYLICGNEIITDTRITEFSKENRKKIQRILENVSEGELPTKRLEIFRKTRLKANTSVGYPIGSLHFESVDNVLSGVLKSVTDFLMMSDGYYKYYDKDVIVEDTLRKIEMDSQQNLIYGKRDDATVLAGVLSDVY